MDKPVNENIQNQLDTLMSGTWFVAATTFPMWKKGNRLQPTFNYQRSSKENTWTDVVRYMTPSGNQKSIRGVDVLQSEIPLKFLWRGNGLLFFVTSRWQIDYVSDDRELMIISFDKTLFTPAGVDVISRTNQLTEDVKIKSLEIVDNAFNCKWNSELTWL